jgi:hypothetical protein
MTPEEMAFKYDSFDNDADDFDLVDKQRKEFINSLTEEEQIQLINAIEYSVLGDIENPTEAVQLAAVKLEGDDIFDIINPSEAVQLAAVEGNCYSILGIINPTEKVQLTAVRNFNFDYNDKRFVSKITSNKAFDLHNKRKKAHKIIK